MLCTKCSRWIPEWSRLLFRKREDGKIYHPGEPSYPHVTANPCGPVLKRDGLAEPIVVDQDTFERMINECSWLKSEST